MFCRSSAMFQITAKNNYITQWSFLFSDYREFVRPFLASRRGLRYRGILGQFIADNNAASSRSSKLSYPMGIHISRPGTRLRSRCLVPCCPGGGQVFRLISRCNFSPFFKRGGPSARPFRGRALLSRGKVRGLPSSTDRGKKKGRLFLSNSR